MKNWPLHQTSSVEVAPGSTRKIYNAARQLAWLDERRPCGNCNSFFFLVKNSETDVIDAHEISVTVQIAASRLECTFGGGIVDGLTKKR